MTSNSSPLGRRILVTGATGYLGGRLTRALERRGFRLTCLTRTPEYLRSRVSPETRVVEGDVLKPETLSVAFEGAAAAYYLVHSMGSGGDFAAEDRDGALNFARAARAAGVERMIYLGGLGSSGELSRHLASRQEVGRVLREAGVPCIEFRASIVIGSGSLSFEMIRALVEKLPIMVTPKWVRARSQPIAVEDVLAYLIEALDAEIAESRVFEIGGADQASYLDIMMEYARQVGLKRWIVPAPVLSPRLSALWLGLVTPLYARVGRKLVDSLRNDTVVVDDSAREVFSVRPRGLREAVARALANEDREVAETRWSDAVSSLGAAETWAGVRLGSRIIDSRTREVAASPARAFAPIRRIGGDVGWYYGGMLWRIRGWLDLLIGGPGLRRGRRDPERLRAGDALDFWRVEVYEPDSTLRLKAEMKLPGRAWLCFDVEPTTNGSLIRHSAVFDPRGLSGLAYWWALYPMHKLIFAGMLRRIANLAEQEERLEAAPAAGPEEPSVAGR